MRLLLDPTADAGGGTPAPTPAAPTPTVTPTPTPAPAPTQGVTLSAEEYRAFLDKAARLEQVEADKRRAEDEREAARLEKLAADGKSKEALDALRKAKDDELATERASRKSLEDQILQSALSAAVTDAISNQSFVSVHAAAQVRRELESRLESVRDASGAVVVREKGTHRSVADAGRAWLASDEAAHFLKAGTKGGVSANGTVPAPATDDKPIDFSTALIAHEKAAMASPSTNPYGLTYRPPTR